jgi:hypothetical protein
MVYLGASFDMNPTNLLAASFDLLAEQAFSCRPRRETPLWSKSHGQTFDRHGLAERLAR